jgi:hypothetical protein
MDINRKIVDYLVLHHAVTGTLESWSKPQIAQWFSDNGFARAYGSNPANWSGLYNPYTGAKSYSQAHYAGQRVDATTPDATDAEKKAGFRLVPLVKDVWGQICWHAGNWEINRASIGIECLGDYRNYTLRDGDCRVIADFWRPQDQKLGGATAVCGHNEVSDNPTACPARIMEMRQLIVDYINNPPKPPAVITVKEETRTERIHFTKTDVSNPELEIGKINVIQKGEDGIVTVVETVTYTDGKETSRVTKSRTITKNPIEEITEIGTKTKDQEQDERLNAIEKILDFFKGVWNALVDLIIRKGKI